MSKLLRGNKKKIYTSKSKRDLEWMDFDDDDIFENGGDDFELKDAVEDGDYAEDVDYEDDDYDDDDYEDDDDDDYDDDEDYDEDVVGYALPVARAGKKKVHHRKSLSDYMVVFTGILVVALLAVAGTLVMKERAIEAQVAAFAEIGNGMEEIPVIGESGLIAISDAQAAKALVAQALEAQTPEPVEEEAELPIKETEVAMNFTSIQKDLKIKFVNKETGKLVPNVAFELDVTGPSDKKYTLVDEDKDGIIYEKDITPGQYTIQIVGPKDLEGYLFPKEASKTKVKDTIEYKKVDVSDEVKTEAQVDVKKEDTKKNETVVESVNQDTVEWVESTKTLIEGTEETHVSYEKVSKDNITDPAKKAAVGFVLLSEVEEQTPVPVPTESEEPTEAPKETEKPKETEAPAPTEAPAQTEAPKETEKPTDKPTEAPQTPKPVETEKPAATPTATPVEVPGDTPTKAPTETQTPEKVPEDDEDDEDDEEEEETPSETPTETPKKKKPKKTPTPNPAETDTESDLKSNSGEQLYVKKSNGEYRKAKYADYYKENVEFYKQVKSVTGKYRYTGWQTIDGATYFFDKNGNYVTGQQVIQGAKYTFNDNGVLNTGSGVLGIDISKWNGNIDFNAVKNSGVSYVIIRCGYRGSTTGALIEDPMFRTNIKGAQNAGLKVGIYFFSQAVNEVEAVQEASMVLGLIKGYNISYPVFLDVEASGGRADGISPAVRTAVCKAFCQTIQNSGYKAGIYANKTWFNSYMDTPSLTGYKIWLAQYAATPTYTRTKYDLWQYSSKGRVAGISGNVDMNISYLGY